MRVSKQRAENGTVVVELLDDDGDPIEIVSGFPAVAGSAGLLAQHPGGLRPRPAAPVGAPRP